MATATEQALFAQPMYPEDLPEYGPYRTEEAFFPGAVTSQALEGIFPGGQTSFIADQPLVEDDGFSPGGFATRAALAAGVPRYDALIPGTYEYERTFPKKGQIGYDQYKGGYDEADMRAGKVTLAPTDNVTVYHAPSKAIIGKIGETGLERFPAGKDVFLTTDRNHPMIREAREAGDEVLQSTLPKNVVEKAVSYDALGNPEMRVSANRANTLFVPSLSSDIPASLQNQIGVRRIPQVGPLNLGNALKVSPSDLAGYRPTRSTALTRTAARAGGLAGRVFNPAGRLLSANQAIQYGTEAPFRALAATGSAVLPKPFDLLALAVEGGLNVGAGVQGAAKEAGEYMQLPENPLPGIFPEGTPDLTGAIPDYQDIRSEIIPDALRQRMNYGAQQDAEGGAPTSLDPAVDAELAFQYNPIELGLDPSQFTRERVGASSNFLANLMAEGTEAQKAAIQRAISSRTAPYLREYLAAQFERDDANSPFMIDQSTGEPIQLAQALRAPQARELSPTPSKTEWFGRRSDDVRFPYPETGFQGIPEFYTEPVEPATFISDPDFTPSLGGHTIAPSGPVVGGTPAVDTFADIPVVQPGAEVPWTPPTPVVPDITQELADFSAIRDADEDRRNREQDERERVLEQAADDRREAEQEARVASARNKEAEKNRIAKENEERKAEEKRISDSQAAEEKKRRATDKQMADMLKQMNATHQAYLDRKKKEEDRRLRQGYGVGAMWT